MGHSVRTNELGYPLDVGREQGWCFHKQGSWISSYSSFSPHLPPLLFSLIFFFLYLDSELVWITLTLQILSICLTFSNSFQICTGGFGTLSVVLVPWALLPSAPSRHVLLDHQITAASIHFSLLPLLWEAWSSLGLLGIGSRTVHQAPHLPS